MQLPLYQVDAFSDKVFAGNPAAICPLETWLPDATMQAIAAENNLAETAFFVRNGERYHLRWFTPELEVDLCGHATLASAFVILNLLEPGRDCVAFDSRSGELRVERNSRRYRLNFPSRSPQLAKSSPGLAEALGLAPAEVWESRDYMAVYEKEEDVRGLRPDMQALARIGHFAVIVTAPGRDCDFVSRFFAPASGVPEDPVTGSAHCTLTPYWAGRLGKKSLYARQVSQRGGELWCEDLGDRVSISGHAVLYLQGNITI